MTKTNDKMTEADRDQVALAEVEADLAGEVDLPMVAVRDVPFVDVRGLRKSLGMSQERFSRQFGFSLGAVRNWEQLRRLPDRSSRILLRLISQYPSEVQKVVAKEV
ncbi:MAG: transcriptional regulator [Pseudomonadota bacterium]